MAKLLLRPLCDVAPRAPEAKVHRFTCPRHPAWTQPPSIATGSACRRSSSHPGFLRQPLTTSCAITRPPPCLQIKELQGRGVVLE